MKIITTGPSSRTHARGASFLKENFVPLKEHGRLKFITSDDHAEWLPGIRVHYVYGHTEAMMLLYIDFNGRTLVYCADLIPSSGHIGLPYVMSYDVRPLETMKEKAALLEQAVEENFILYFDTRPEGSLRNSCPKRKRPDYFG